jgi:hypothetical protein
MKHIKLFEQFVKESITIDIDIHMALESAAGNGRSIGRYNGATGASAEWDNQTVISNASEYSIEILTDASVVLRQAGIQVKEKSIQDGILTTKFGGTTWTYQFKGGKWIASVTDSNGTAEAPKDIYEFIRFMVARKYIKFKDKSVGSK